MFSLDRTLAFCVAGLTLSLDHVAAKARVELPPSFTRFVTPIGGMANSDDLHIIFRDEQAPQTVTALPVLTQTEIWELRRDTEGAMIFATRRERQTRVLRVNRDYTAGELFLQTEGMDNLSYPLQNLDILLMANWLAERADLLLHASGVILDGHGYAFLGDSGAGKSTLAAQLCRDHCAEVLGEDQVALRWMGEKFWIIGTPWHENPEMCSPSSAPVEGLFLLDRKHAPGLSKLSASEAVTAILQTAFVPYYRPEVIGAILDRLTILTQVVPIYQLSYRLNVDQPWEMIQNGINCKKSI